MKLLILARVIIIPDGRILMRMTVLGEIFALFVRSLRMFVIRILLRTLCIFNMINPHLTF